MIVVQVHLDHLIHLGHQDPVAVVTGIIVNIKNIIHRQVNLVVAAGVAADIVIMAVATRDLFRRMQVWLGLSRLWKSIFKRAQMINAL